MIINRIVDYVKATKYNIGFVEQDLNSILEGKPITVNWLKHSYKDRWFADPFILDVSDTEIIVLVEEWYDPIQRGRISKIIVDRSTYELKTVKVMIDEGSHLSFPAIERRGNDIYIYPERAGTFLKSYKYNADNDCFEKKSVVSKLPLTDSVITDLFGQRLLFSTKMPDSNGKELGIYSWNEENKEFVIQDYYQFNENISRMAGNFFIYNNKIYRPAQVCIKSYGDAVSIQEVTCKDQRWEFKELFRLYSPHHDLDLGFHTFNVYNDVIVVDAIGYRNPKLCHILRKLNKLLKCNGYF